MERLNISGRVSRHFTMDNLNLGPIALGLTLLLTTTVIGQAQSASPENLQDSEKAYLVKLPSTQSQRSVEPTAITGYCTYFTRGQKILTCYTGAITANSTVLAEISEYYPNPNNRFIGAARMTVHNVAPFNGGVKVWVNIEWSSSLRVRLDIRAYP
jgi:hypothetical protein